MPALQSINLGTAPDGTGGDTSRSAFTKINANTDTLQSCLPLNYAVISDSTILKPTDVGSRFILGTAAGKVITLPLASAVPRNSVVQLTNNGNAVSVSTQGTDIAEIASLNRGDWAAYVSDGTKYWHVMARGRMLPDEVVSGSLSVGGDISAGGKIGGMAGANLLVNSTGELGNIGWNGTNFTADRDPNGGNGTLFRNTNTLTGSPQYNYSDYVPAVPGTKVAIQGVISSAGMTAGAAAIGVEFLDASNVLLSVVSPATVPFGSPATFRTAAGTAPANTAKMRFLIGVTASPAGPAGAATYTNLKYEIGTSASTYSQEASIAYLGGSPALAGRPTFAGKVPWDSGNFNPAGYAALGSSNTFTAAQCVYAANNLAVGAFRVTGDWGNLWGAWSNAANTAVQMDCPTVGSAYFGLRFTRWGARHLAAIAAYEPNTSASPMLGFLIGSDSQATGPTFQFMQGGIGTYAGSWTQTSDHRVKKDFTSIDRADALSRIARLSPYEYARVESVYGDRRFAGFKAHEVQEEFPLQVTGEKDAVKVLTVDGETSESPDLQAVDYIGLIPYIVAAVQALSLRVQELEQGSP